MAEEIELIEPTLKEKLLFYTTAFFILLATFSLFAFLFLVPFVIDPAFTTIFMQFDTNPATCYTVDYRESKGIKNCTWASCREGCTKELFECTQILVSYKKGKINESSTKSIDDMILTENQINLDDSPQQSPNELLQSSLLVHSDKQSSRISERAVRDYDYVEENRIGDDSLNDDMLNNPDNNDDIEPIYIDETQSGLAPNNSEWHFFRARLLPNVKGCGYPPMLNCTIWNKKYKQIGSNYSCFYSQVDPNIVISDLDLHQNMLNLIYAMAIPIPSFIISIIYLTFAYFKIYNEDEETAPLDKNAEDIDGGAEDDDDEGNIPEKNENDINGSDIVLPNGSTILSASGHITPNSDLASFGHQLKVKMVDEMSRDSIDGGLISNSGSIQG